MDFRQALHREDWQRFTHKSDLMGWWLLGFNWGMIALAFILVWWWPGPLTVLLALILLGNRQLGLGILMHECAHGTLFKAPKINQWVGHWLCAAPVLAQLDGYRRYHLQHHKLAGSREDPDYPSYKNYPVTKGSLLRKCLRDLTGVTFVKTFYLLLLMYAELIDYDMAYQNSKPREQGIRPLTVMSKLASNMFPSVLVNLILFGVLFGLGQPWLYVLWVLAYMTTYMLFARIRNAAEHASVPDLLSRDPRLHARTTRACWWERLTFAPNYVNYHLEHHWVPGIPCHQLPAFHRFLLAEGLLQAQSVAPGYLDVLRQMTDDQINRNRTTIDG